MKNFKHLLSFAICLIIATASAQAGEWLEILKDRGITYYIDEEITEEANGYIVWAKMNFTTKASRAKITREAKSKRTVYSAMICFLYNYLWAEYASVCGHLYNANGDVIFSEKSSLFRISALGSRQQWAHVGRCCAIHSQPRRSRRQRISPHQS